jgi:hypothetical protein
VFDTDQILQYFFAYQKDIEGFSKADGLLVGVSPIESIEAARAIAIEKDIKTTEGECDLIGIHRKWIRFEYQQYAIHYEYRPIDLYIITVMKRDNNSDA